MMYFNASSAIFGIGVSSLSQRVKVRNICYDRANEVCPNGYTTISGQAGFNRKELRIACPIATVTK
jgi:hypothetical protein